ncbi:RluA family pseudouridine synthase [Candidatus Saccharibacteria bacterium]|nr:RluA family pseudouridine synthase [Candidatus Saccharibacteria bacterium]
MDVRELNQKIVVSKSGRLDVILADQLPERSRAFWQKAIDSSYIYIDGEVCHQKKQKVHLGDILKIDIPNQAAAPIAIEIIFEDEDVVVVNKPSGMLAHNKSHWLPEQSVVESIFEKLEHDKLKKSFRPGIVHRLDRATSGVMIVAKNTKALGYLQKQFADRKVTKQYFAITSGVPIHKQAEIDIAIGRDLKRPTAFKPDKDGKVSKTIYRVLNLDDKHALLELLPLTGRTHQLRVHLQSIGTPIVGDEIYGGESAPRLLLHAKSLKLKLPSGETKTFSTELPDEISDFFS